MWRAQPCVHRLPGLQTSQRATTRVDSVGGRWGTRTYEPQPRETPFMPLQFPGDIKDKPSSDAHWPNRGCLTFTALFRFGRLESRRSRSSRVDSRHNGSMELQGATQDLYRIAPAEFTAARDAVASEARRMGDSELASSLKKLRKPSVGAWLANLLVLEQPGDVERLVDLGTELRAPNRNLDGDQIRRVSKAKGEAITKLVRDARSKASRAGRSVSAAASEELEATLEAAFADPVAAESLLGGRLSSGLHYSGLGFGEQTASGSPTGTKGSGSPRRTRSEADLIAAERNLKEANHEAELADADLASAREAVARAAQELTRLKSAETLALRRSKTAQARVSAAKKKLSKVQIGRRPR